MKSATREQASSSSGATLKTGIKPVRQLVIANDVFVCSGHIVSLAFDDGNSTLIHGTARDAHEILQIRQAMNQPHGNQRHLLELKRA